MGQQPKHSNAFPRRHIYLPVSDHRSDETIALTEGVAAHVLIAVVQLFVQVERVVGVQDRRRWAQLVVINCPHNPIIRAAGRDARRAAGIPNAVLVWLLALCR